MDDYRQVPDSEVHDREMDGQSGGSADWLIVAEGFDPTRERGIETLLTVANGYAGTRGSLEEGHPACRPGTLLAGVFDPILAQPVPPAEPGESPRLVRCPDWIDLAIEIDGQPVALEPSRVLAHHRKLDLRQSLMVRHWRQRLAAGPILRLDTWRCLSLADRHVFLQQVRLLIQDSGGRIRLKAVLDGRADGALVPFPEVPNADQPENAPASLNLCTAHSRIQVAMAQSCALFGEDAPLRARHWRERQAKAVADCWEWRAEAGRAYGLERVVAGFTSREAADPLQRAVRHASRAHRAGFAQLLDAHRLQWAERWRAAGIEIVGDPAAQRAVRFAGYHLMAAAQPEDERVSIGARTLSGEAYQGHVFWDTEIYMLPFFIYTWPAAARALLMYRHHTLEAACAKAARLGYRGALYAWESAASGHEATAREVRSPEGEIIPIHTGEREHHISAAIAYAVQQYWQATGDDRFLLDAGAEIVLETARFWASRASSEADGSFHIRQTMGPDEYHELVDDSAYVNAMARFNLEFGLDTAAWLQRHHRQAGLGLRDRLKLDDRELEEWRGVAAGLVDGDSPGSGLIEEFAGYFDLEDLDLRSLEPRAAAIQVLLGIEATARTQVVKQADVVLLMFLLGDRYDPAAVARNFDYYEPRCDHASSLSPSIHALVAARLGHFEAARRYFDQAAALDLADEMGNAALGLHAANCGGLWQAVVFGAAGMQPMEDGLGFDPRLLPGWESLSFAVEWRGRRLEVKIQGEPARVHFTLARDAGPMTIRVGRGDKHSLSPGTALTLPYA